MPTAKTFTLAAVAIALLAATMPRAAAATPPDVSLRMPLVNARYRGAGLPPLDTAVFGLLRQDRHGGSNGKPGLRASLYAPPPPAGGGGTCARFCRASPASVPTCLCLHACSPTPSGRTSPTRPSPTARPWTPWAAPRLRAPPSAPRCAAPSRPATPTPGAPTPRSAGAPCLC